jgi:hypothetical protein
MLGLVHPFLTLPHGQEYECWLASFWREEVKTEARYEQVAKDVEELLNACTGGNLLWLGKICNAWKLWKKKNDAKNSMEDLKRVVTKTAGAFYRDIRTTLRSGLEKVLCCNLG